MTKRHTTTARPQTKSGKTIPFYRVAKRFAALPISWNCKAVLMCLWDYRNAKKGIYPGIDTIGAALGMKYNTVRQTLRFLRDKHKLITWTVRKNTNVEGAPKTNLYVFTDRAVRLIEASLDSNGGIVVMQHHASLDSNGGASLESNGHDSELGELRSRDSELAHEELADSLCEAAHLAPLDRAEREPRYSTSDVEGDRAPLDRNTEVSIRATAEVERREVLDELEEVYVREMSTSFPEAVTTAWAAKQRGQVWQLVDRYEADNVSLVFAYVGRTWPRLRATRQLRAAYPSIGIIVSLAEMLFAEAPRWAEARITQHDPRSQRRQLEAADNAIIELLGYDDHAAEE